MKVVIAFALRTLADHLDPQGSTQSVLYRERLQRNRAEIRRLDRQYRERRRRERARTTLRSVV